MNVVLLALAAGRFLSKESQLAAVQRAIRQVPGAPEVTPAVLSAGTAGAASEGAQFERLEGLGGALANAVETKVGAEMNLEKVWAANNATIDHLQSHVEKAVARATSKLDAQVAAREDASAAMGEAINGSVPAVNTLVDPTAVIDGTLVNETQNISRVTNISKNTTAVFNHFSQNWTASKAQLFNRTNETAVLSNFTHDYVHAIVDPHWGPRAVNATENASSLVREARQYSSAVDWQVQNAANEGKQAQQDADDALHDASEALRTAESALKQATDNSFKLKAAEQLAKEAQDKSEVANTQAAAAVTVVEG